MRARDPLGLCEVAEYVSTECTVDRVADHFDGLDESVTLFGVGA